jgi:hypothetical protein
MIVLLGAATTVSWQLLLRMAEVKLN